MKEKIKSGLLVLVGISLVSIAISMFFVPNKIVNGAHPVCQPLFTTQLA